MNSKEANIVLKRNYTLKKIIITRFYRNSAFKRRLIKQVHIFFYEIVIFYILSVEKGLYFTFKDEYEKTVKNLLINFFPAFSTLKLCMHNSIFYCKNLHEHSSLNW